MGLDDLRLPASFLKRIQPAGNGEPRRRPKPSVFSFCKFPVKAIEDIIMTPSGKAVPGPEALLAVLLVLCQLHFRRFGQNPVRLTSESLRKYNVSRHQKLRALKFLEKAGHIAVQRTGGENPIVTLNWLPLKK